MSIAKANIYGTFPEKNHLKDYLESYLLYKNIKIYKDDMLHCILGRHSDKHPSMHLFVGDDKKPRLTCHACGETIDIFGAVRCLEKDKPYFKDQYDFLMQWTNKSHKVDHIEKPMRPICKVHEKKQPPTQEEVQDYLNSCNGLVGYGAWKIRGIGKDVVDTYGLTYNTRDNALVIPLKPEGYIQRFLKPENESKKYRRTVGLSKCFRSLTFDPSLPIIVTEGEIDGISILEAGYPNVWAIGGVTKANKWIKAIHNYSAMWPPNENNINPNLIIAVDNDEPGQNGYIKIVEICMSEGWGKPLNFWDNLMTDEMIQVKDINELLCKHRNVLIDTLEAFKRIFGGYHG